MRTQLIVNAIRKRKNDTLLEFGEGSVLLIDPSLVEKLSLEPDGEFDLALLLSLNEPYSRKRAAAYALDYLERSARSTRQLTDHLFSKNIQASVISETVDKLVAKNILNDRDLAERLAGDMIGSGRSLRRTREKLRRRGLDGDTIAESTSFAEGAIEEGNLKGFIRSKNESLRRYPPLIRKEKLIRSAVSAGFSSSAAAREADGITRGEDPSEYGDYYRALGEKRLRELEKKDLSRRELTGRFTSEMLAKGCPRRIIDECLQKAQNGRKDPE
ncbi:MAG: RecX family transcriptional regulator [Eubacteriaceae bacterium]|nr:RecX family transcriptional regulator [Eubacteriaceae bacterium]